MLHLAKIWVHNNTSSSEKMVFSEPGEKYAQIKQSLHDKTDILVDFDVRERQGMDFFTGGSVMDYGLTLWTKVCVMDTQLLSSQGIN